MISAIFTILFLVGTIVSEAPCEKLKIFGNKIQNKAVLAPVVLVGQSGMQIPDGNDRYKITIDIRTIIKGTLGNWKKNIIIAGDFVPKSNQTDLCSFMSSKQETRIYFLQVIESQNGEYRVLFNSEEFTQDNVGVINRTICISCTENPKLIIKELYEADNRIQLDCLTESQPHPIVKWNHSSEKSIKTTELRNGARLRISGENMTDSMYVCRAANVLGETTASILIRERIVRCTRKDKELCNDNGNCYQDKIDNDKMFCRCNSEFEGQNCSKKVSPTPNKEGNVLRSRKNDISKENKLEIKKMLDNATSKVAINYIIIVCAIVVGSCFVVVIVLVTLWRCYFIRRYGNTSSRRYHDDSLFERKLRSNGNNSPLDSKRNDGLILLPGYTEGSKIPSSSIPRTNIIEISENGIYEGVPMPINLNTSSPRHVQF